MAGMKSVDVTGAAGRLIVRQFNSPQDYQSCWQSMKDFTQSRDDATADEVWLLEHPPIFTQGIRDGSHDLLDTGDIPVLKTDRGGLVTYHAPGQLIVYLMLDLRRLGTGLRELVNILEQVVIDLLSTCAIEATRRKDAPGVYVDGRKIASLGLRVQRHCTYHGVSLNVDMDLEPFEQIVPCGLRDIKMIDMKSLGVTRDIDDMSRHFVQVLSKRLRYNPDFQAMP